MRDPERIPEVLKEIGRMWVYYPDLRLGQLICNVCPDMRDPYYIEDDELVKRMKRVYLQGKNPTD